MFETPNWRAAPYFHAFFCSQPPPKKKQQRCPQIQKCYLTALCSSLIPDSLIQAPPARRSDGDTGFLSLLWDAALLFFALWLIFIWKAQTRATLTQSPCWPAESITTRLQVVVYVCLGFGRFLWSSCAPRKALLCSFKEKRRLNILSPQSQPHFTPVGLGPLLGGGKCGLEPSRLKKALKPDFSLHGPAILLARLLIKKKGVCTPVLVRV